MVGQCTITSLEQFRCDPYVITAEGARSSKSREAPQGTILKLRPRGEIHSCRVVPVLLTVALMMASPHKNVAINMEENRPLLEAQVTLPFRRIQILPFPLFDIIVVTFSR